MIEHNHRHDYGHRYNRDQLTTNTAAGTPMAVAPSVGNCTHTLCCQLSCNFVQRVGVKARYEGMGIASLSEIASAYSNPNVHGSEVIPLFDYVCGENGTDLTMGPKDWTPAQGGPCEHAKPSHRHSAIKWFHRVQHDRFGCLKDPDRRGPRGVSFLDQFTF